MEERRTLVELPSGKIEMVWTGVWATIQFNANCLDCLPYCKAMCCRVFSIQCTPEEAQRFKTRPHPISKQPTLERNQFNVCNYLQPDCKCGVHKEKPAMCDHWACSPGCEPGNDKITRRDAGWLLNLVRREEAELVRLQLAENEDDASTFNSP